MAVSYHDTLRNNRLDEITARAGTSAKLRIYSGTRPSNSGAETTQLVELTCNATAFAPAATGGVLTPNAVSAANAGATGTASWYRVYASDGTTIVLDGDVGASDLDLDNTSINTGQQVSISSWTITEGNDYP